MDKKIDYGEGSASNPGFPNMPIWFRDNRDWHNIIIGLKNIGFKAKNENYLSNISQDEKDKYSLHNAGSIPVCIKV